MNVAAPIAAGQIPNFDTLFAQASEMTPILAARGAEGDKNGRTADDLIEQIAERGLFKVTQPVEYGGYGYTAGATCVVNEPIARGDGSASWITMNLHAGIWNAGIHKEEARHDVWGQNPGARVCTVTSPRGTCVKVPGGYKVSGRWPFASGCLHAQWATIGAREVNEAGEMIGVHNALVPMTDLTIDIDWNVGGFRGTGSNTLVLDDVFVPDHRVAALPPMSEGINPYEGSSKNSLYYRTSLSSLFTVCVFGPIIGLGESMIDVFTGALPGREIAYSAAQQIESEIVHLHVAQMRMAVDMARLLSDQQNAVVDTAAAEGRPLTYQEKVKLRASMSYAARGVLEGAQNLMADAGGRGIAEAGRTPRVMRDIQAINVHGIVNPLPVLTAYGATLLGQMPKLPIF